MGDAVSCRKRVLSSSHRIAFDAKHVATCHVTRRHGMGSMRSDHDVLWCVCCDDTWGVVTATSLPDELRHSKHCASSVSHFSFGSSDGVYDLPTVKITNVSFTSARQQLQAWRADHLSTHVVSTLHLSSAVPANGPVCETLESEIRTSAAHVMLFVSPNIACTRSASTA